MPNPTVVGLEDLRDGTVICLKCLGLSEAEARELWHLDGQLLLCRKEESHLTAGHRFPDGKCCDGCGEEMVVPYYMLATTVWR